MIVRTGLEEMVAKLTDLETALELFRDDVIFLIYLYQRRIYSVDMSRGVAGEDAAQ